MHNVSETWKKKSETEWSLIQWGIISPLPSHVISTLVELFSVWSDDKLIVQSKLQEYVWKSLEKIKVLYKQKVLLVLLIFKFSSSMIF